MSKLIDDLYSLQNLLESTDAEGEDLLSHWPLRKEPDTQEKPAEADQATSPAPLGSQADDATPVLDEAAATPALQHGLEGHAGNEAVAEMPALPSDGDAPAPPPASDIAQLEQAEVIPLLDEAEDPDAIPLLDELAFEEGASETDAQTAPDPEELLELVDTLVERRLHRLKPDITELVMEELEAIYPGLRNK